MLDKSSDHSSIRVLSLVRRILVSRREDRPLSPRDELADIGMSSIDMVNLMLSVEAEFNIVIPQSELTIENFHTVHSIEILLDRLIDDRAAAVG
jgi:acyl carrier protein